MWVDREKNDRLIPAFFFRVIFACTNLAKSRTQGFECPVHSINVKMSPCFLGLTNSCQGPDTEK